MTNSKQQPTCTILLIEDGQVHRNIFDSHLRRDDYRFLYAVGYDDALQILECNPIDLIVLDGSLADSASFELCRNIRETKHISEIPILMIVNKEDPDVRKEGLLSGVDDFITAPLDRDVLRARIRLITRLNRYRTLNETYKQLEEQNTQLSRLKNFDATTGLANFSMFKQSLEEALKLATRSDFPIAVMAICASEYDQVLGVYGEAPAEELARSLADRLTRATRGRGLVGRIDGRCFIAFQPLPREDELLSAVHRYRKQFNDTFMVSGEELRITSSIGASVFPSDADDAEKLINLAVSAMTHASKAGRNRYHVFAPAARADVKRQLRLESQIVKSLESHGLEFHYQPRINLADGRVNGIEALLRMRDENGSFVPPNIFLPVAQSCGLMTEIGIRAINKACEDVVALTAHNHPRLRVSINLSGDELRNPDFMTIVRQAMQSKDICGKSLEFEISETALVPTADFDLQNLGNLLSAIRVEGILVTIDDFGTGYSSLNNLRHFPIDAIKIDQSFVRDIPNDPKAIAVARSIIALGQNLGLRVVAEGVETDQQLNFLRQSNCSDVQGYLFARPMPFDELLVTLDQLEDDWTGLHQSMEIDIVDTRVLSDYQDFVTQKGSM